MMHDPVVEGIHAAWYAKERSQKHDCYEMRHSIACGGVTNPYKALLFHDRAKPVWCLESERQKLA